MAKVIADRDGPFGLAQSVILGLEASSVRPTPKSITQYMLVSEYGRVLSGIGAHDGEVVRAAFWSLVPPSDR